MDMKPRWRTSTLLLPRWCTGDLRWFLPGELQRFQPVFDGGVLFERDVDPLQGRPTTRTTRIRPCLDAVQ
jgi:hypothetical protein